MKFFSKKNKEVNVHCKNYVIRVRVSPDEKTYLKKLAKINQGDNVSAFLRKLIFEVYAYDIKNKQEFLARSMITMKPYIFDYNNRTEFVHVRLTTSEKEKLYAYARYSHRDVSEFIRWISLQVYVDSFIKEAF